MTSYPVGIDTSSTLPLAIDKQTKVVATAVNNLRNAIVAIETELGDNPSSTYSSVRARLDAISENVTGTIVDQLTSESKIRVYRNAAGFTGNSAGMSQTVTFDTVSALLNQITATQAGSGNQITTTQIGTYHVAGQLSLSPSTSAVTSILLEVIKSGSVVHSYSDAGAGWDANVTRTFDFAFDTEMASSDDISVRWTHEESAPTTITLIAGDPYSWMSMEKYNSLASAPIAGGPSGSIAFIVTSIKTSTYTTAIGEFVRCNSSGGGFAVNLPTAAGNSGLAIVFKNIVTSSNTVTIHAHGSETIDNSNTFALTGNLSSITLVSDNISNWMVI